MATKPRHKKTETQLWVYDNAKRLGLSEVDLARATGVEPGTARSWFSRGKPNADAVAILERLFGRPAPNEETGPTLSGEAGLAAAIRELADELREWRKEREAFDIRLAAVEASVALQAQPSDAGLLGRESPPVGAASGR